MIAIKRILSVLSVFLFLVSCEKEFLSVDTKATSSKDTMRLTRPQKAIGDGVYDVLGYGYDASGVFMSNLSVKNPVIDVNKFYNSEPANIDIGLPIDGERMTISGSNIEEYKTNLSAHLDSHVGIAKFSGDVNVTFTTATSYNTNYSYARYTSFTYRKRLLINSTIDNLTKYLSAQFLNDIQNQDANYIVRTYGTHVLTGIYLGQRLDFSYEGISSSTNKKESVEAGLKISVGKVFTFNTNVNVRDSLAKTVKEATLNFRYVGGEPNKIPDALSISMSLIPLPTYDLNPWLESCSMDNARFINIVPNTMINIYDLIKDPYKKIAVKEATERYLRGENINYGTYPDLFEYSGILRVNRTTTIDIYKFDINYNNNLAYSTEKHICKLFPNNIVLSGLLPLYLVEKAYTYSDRTTPRPIYLKSYRISTNEVSGGRIIGRLYKYPTPKTIPLYEYYDPVYGQYSYSLDNRYNYRVNSRSGNIYKTSLDLIGVVGYIPK